MRWLLHCRSILVYCTIPYYTIQKILRDHSNTKLGRFMWYTTFWPPMSANSKMVNNISVALLVFKWAARICIVYMGQIYYDQWTNSCYTTLCSIICQIFAWFEMGREPKHRRNIFSILIMYCNIILSMAWVRLSASIFICVSVSVYYIYCCNTSGLHRILNPS